MQNVATLLLFIVGFFSLLSSQTAEAATCNAGAAFKITVKTDNAGSSDSTSFTIPTSGSGYSYRVDINGDDDWADTSVGGSWNETTNRTGTTTINFGTAGTYNLSICGNFPRILFNNGGDKGKLLLITQWGDNTWTNMSSAFYGAINLDVTATDVPTFGPNVNLSGMFRGASSLVGNASFSSWNTSNATNMQYMFNGNVLFNQPIGGWDTSNVTNMQFMFANATSFNQPIGGWDTGNVTSLSSTFIGATAFNQPLNDWDVSNVTTMASLFYNAAAFNQTLNDWDVSNVTVMSSTFRYAVSFNQPLDNWDTGSVTTMLSMFHNATIFNQPIGNWDVSNVTTMSSMFAYAVNFNQSLDGWDTESVTSMHQMFYNAVVFNGPIDGWDTSSVTTMSSMFAYAAAFNQPVNNWDVSNVSIMEGVFRHTDHFNQPLNNWNTSAATTMASMFRAALVFNQPLNNWDVSNVTTFRDMFASYLAVNTGPTTLDVTSVQTSFNQNLSSWNTSTATDMAGMFGSEPSEMVDYYNSLGFTTVNVFDDPSITNPYTYPLASWDIENVTNLQAILSGSRLSPAAYEATLLSWSQQTVQPGILLGATGLTYCSQKGKAARQALITNHLWTINDAGERCSPTPLAPNTGLEPRTSDLTETIFATIFFLEVVYVTIFGLILRQPRES